MCVWSIITIVSFLSSLYGPARSSGAQASNSQDHASSAAKAPSATKTDNAPEPARAVTVINTAPNAAARGFRIVGTHQPPAAIMPGNDLPPAAIMPAPAQTTLANFQGKGLSFREFLAYKNQARATEPIGQMGEQNEGGRRRKGTKRTRKGRKRKNRNHRESSDDTTDSDSSESDRDGRNGKRSGANQGRGDRERGQALAAQAMALATQALQFMQ